jgi:hypothetical protein
MGSSCNNPGNLELGAGGNDAGTANTISFDATSSTLTSIYEVKAKFMKLSRLPVFHYGLVGLKIDPVGAAGVAELFGNDLYLVNKTSSGVFLHELGHNLGLSHGGFEGTNYKPNYISIMNYLYGVFPKTGTSNEGSLYYNYLKSSKIDPGSTNCYSNPIDYDTTSSSYSEGLSSDLDENSILEAKGLGRSNSSPVDYNCNGVIDSSPFSLNLNPVQGFGGTDSVKTVLKDYNDWGNLKLTFRNYYSGFRNTYPTDPRQIPVHSYMNNDKQEIADERGMPIR